MTGRNAPTASIRIAPRMLRFSFLPSPLEPSGGAGLRARSMAASLFRACCSLEGTRVAVATKPATAAALTVIQGCSCAQALGSTPCPRRDLISCQACSMASRAVCACWARNSASLSFCGGASGSGAFGFLPDVAAELLPLAGLSAFIFLHQVSAERVSQHLRPEP